ncbi:MAG: hypothetical protein UY89_C0003G0029 [Parcubacteria group bacterium GW2011_GWA1_54_9]|nr:MAG: hypothetical protein UY89_C0003G0029 [Parcubacteria group bacterium GW2011_GWA1_54_9]KKW42283.1 MAG: hypothetical protein UY91_C0005G0005 [Parcubacteria group bacterium GW2011_GWB1_55_9]
MHLAFFQFRNECLVLGENLEHSLAPGKRDRDHLSVKEIFSDFCDRKVERFHILHSVQDLRYAET